MANQKVVFFDIDGTLLHDGHFVPESTKQAIRKLQENGVYVALATSIRSSVITGKSSFIKMKSSTNVHNLKSI